MISIFCVLLCIIMEEIKKLYPLSFMPIGETFAWGGSTLTKKYEKEFVESDDQGNEKLLAKGSNVAESHEIADLGYRDSQIKSGWLAGNTISEIMDIYVDRIVGESVFKFFGRQFPVGVKFIDASGKIPLQVHPDDEIAAERYDFLGKAKLWYVVDAKPGSKVYMGFKKDAEVTEFYNRCFDGQLDDMLNVITPKKGDYYMIEPGTVHSASDGVILLEVSEASPLDFCLSGWGKEVPADEFDSALSIVEAMDFINYSAHKESEAPQQDASGLTRRLTKRQEFTVNEITLTDPLHIFTDRADSFTLYTCIDGEASIQIRNDNDMDSYILTAGSTMLVPAEIEDFFLVPRQSGTVLIEALVEAEELPDRYIDPNAEEKLPEDE